MHYKHNKNIFVRKVKDDELEDYNKYKEKINDQVNISSKFISESKLLELFDLKTYKFFLVLCFEKVKDWINKNEVYTEEYINKLKEILHNFRLDNKLTSYEEEYLNHFNAVVFNKKRNLKQLITDFPSEKNELTCFSFSEAKIYKKNEKNELIEKIGKCEIYISSIRVIINLPSYIYSLYFKDVFSYKLENNLFRLDILNYHSKNFLNHFYFDTSDNYVLYVSFQRVFNQFLK